MYICVLKSNVKHQPQYLKTCKIYIYILYGDESTCAMLFYFPLFLLSNLVFITQFHLILLLFKTFLSYNKPIHISSEIPLQGLVIFLLFDLPLDK